MGVLSKLGLIFVILVIVAILLYLYDKPLFDSFISSIYKSTVATNTSTTGLSSSENNTLLKHQISFLSNETNAIASSSPIPIKQVAVFGTGTNTTTLIPIDAIYNFSSQGTSQVFTLYNGFYVPTYGILKENYYNSNSVSIGDYLPSLIGEKVYLNFIAINNRNISVPYIIKSENIEGNKVIWNMTFDGSINNTTTTLYNNTINCLNGIVLLNNTILLSPRNPCIK